MGEIDEELENDLGKNNTLGAIERKEKDMDWDAILQILTMGKSLDFSVVEKGTKIRIHFTDKNILVIEKYGDWSVE